MLDKKTVTVRRKNVYLDVVPELVDKYVAKGYDVLDSNGNVVKQSVPQDIESLRLAFDNHTKTIARLQDRIKELEAELKTKSKISDVAEQAPAKTETTVETKQKATGKKSKRTV
jgi:uncharacterized small protein (DUF1192 family)